VQSLFWLFAVRAGWALLLVAATISGLLNSGWRRCRLCLGCRDHLYLGSPNTAGDVLFHCMRLLSHRTYTLYLRTEARTNPRHMSLVTCSSIELVVSIDQAFNWSWLDHRFGQQLPTEITSSM